MKVFEVIYETDGRTIKEPGIVETEVKTLRAYYAADDFDGVWAATTNLRNDPEHRFKGINMVLESVNPVGYSRLVEALP